MQGIPRPVFVQTAVVTSRWPASPKRMFCRIVPLKTHGLKHQARPSRAMPKSAVSRHAKVLPRESNLPKKPKGRDETADCCGANASGLLRLTIAKPCEGQHPLTASRLLSLLEQLRDGLLRAVGGRDLGHLSQSARHAEWTTPHIQQQNQHNC